MLYALRIMLRHYADFMLIAFYVAAAAASALRCLID